MTPNDGISSHFIISDAKFVTSKNSLFYSELHSTGEKYKYKEGKKARGKGSRKKDQEKKNWTHRLLPPNYELHEDNQLTLSKQALKTRSDTAYKLSSDGR
ncbi:hypothetical protein M426DRAFT_244657 [Hypoxylon sp. CI-4A]|nr:hypothetical protein M426DRAFT_244657 [Hypoxylon sp. CI-4A]